MELTPERWRRIEALLDDVLEVGPDGQAAFLDRACPADLRPDLDALLAADADVLPLLDDATAHPVLTLLDAAGREAEIGPGTWVGRQVGAWRIEEEVGRGGMGAVYRATRADGQFEQTAALKRLGYGGPGAEAVRRRFLQERQILARLQHPNIARLLDGGVTDEGTPYLVMDYVEGEPITTYCDRHRLPVEARLRLFEAVCEAVQYAHQGLVVHRDLKPSNVLVDRHGRAKLLDFGIAKLLNPDPSGLPEEPGVAPLTQTGGAVMTPEYAAPEQVRGEVVTTATDVYALGVLLYELLAGHRPYVFESRAPGVVERVVCEAEPERPSAVVGRPQDRRSRGAETQTVEPEAVSRARATSPDRLRRALAGDLDTLVLKALRKEPERRYATAAELAEDLRRYRTGLPILARPDTAGYRARKFVRRHRLGVAAAGAVALALVLGLVGTAWQARAAQAEAAKARAVTEFLVRLFEASDPSQARGATLTARELLDEGRERVEALDGQPAVQAELVGALGRVYHGLGLYREAEALLRQALTLRRDSDDAPHPDVADALHRLGLTVYELGGFLEAKTLLREELVMRRALQPGPHPATAGALGELARAVEAAGTPREARRLYLDALAMQEALQRSSPEVARRQVALADFLQKEAEFAQADSLYDAALATQRQILGADHPETARTLRSFALAKRVQQDLAAADSLLQQALALQRRVLGPDHPEVAKTLNETVGLMVFRQEPWADVDSAAQVVLAMQREALGEAHPEVAQTLFDLGVAATNWYGDRAAGEPPLRAALAIWHRIARPDHPQIAATSFVLGTALARWPKDDGDAEESLALLREASAICRAALSDEARLTYQVLLSLGYAERLAGNYEAAEQAFLEGLRRTERAEGIERGWHASMLGHLVQTYRDWGRPADGLPYARRADTLFAATYPPDDLQHVYGRRTYAELLVDLGRYDEAEPMLLELHQRYRNRLGPDEEPTRHTARELVRLYETSGRPEQAARYRSGGS